MRTRSGGANGSVIEMPLKRRSNRTRPGFAFSGSNRAVQAPSGDLQVMRPLLSVRQSPATNANVRSSVRLSIT